MLVRYEQHTCLQYRSHELPNLELRVGSGIPEVDHRELGPSRGIHPGQLTLLDTASSI